MNSVSVIHCGYFKLDGGAMFGVVPKRMWAKLNPPDEQNMCTWSMKALLVRSPDGRNVLVDTGMGNKQDERFRSHFMPFGDENLFDSLAAQGLTREDITDVFLTHLHFDHCGGALWKNEATGQIEPSFSNAKYWTNQIHWDWAMNPNAREKASFLKENFEPLLQMGLLHFVPLDDPDWQLVEGFGCRFFYGHTEAMMAPVIQTNQGVLIYCADALPSQWHLPMPYVMAYDIRPLVTLQEKAVLLQEAVASNAILFLEHDPIADCLTLKETDGKIVADRVGVLADFLG